MKVYHVTLQVEDGWYCAQAMEDPAVFTQGRSLDEVTANVREVADLLYGEKDVQVELIVPPSIRIGAGGAKGKPISKPRQPKVRRVASNS
jgi:predicted RNase H-like HicB family nuclease